MNRLAAIRQAISDAPSKVQIERKEQVGIIWMNSPKDLNSLSKEMVNLLMSSIEELNLDPTVKVILLRSRVDNIFCAGANIKQFVTHKLDSYPESARFRKIALTFRHYHKPLVAVVEGKALGGGFQIALLSDIILCSNKAKFALPEINLGIIPGIGGTQILTRIVGEKVAKRMILTGQMIDAQQAHRLNIAQLLPADRFEDAVWEIVGGMSSKSGETLIGANRAIKAAWQTTLQQGMDHEASIFHSLFNKKGAKEGIQAFIEKRKPNFKGI